MDNDKRSVSDFYGGQSSGNQSSAGAQRQRKESNTSSFFNPRTSGDMLATAGYNRDSYLDTGRSAPLQDAKDEETAAGGWDVYADFNNAGPRYATFGAQDTGYRPLGPVRGAGPEPEPLLDPNAPQVELVTVPALGPEWKADELADMTKSHKRQVRNDERWRKLKMWNRDQHGFCGGWGTRKTLVWGFFITIIIVGILLAFMVPRVPNISFYGTTPLTPGEGNATFIQAPVANFTFKANLALQIDTNANFLPLTINGIDATIYASDTDRQVGNGTLPGFTLPAKQYNPITFPVVFAFETQNNTEPTFHEFYDACRNRKTFSDNIRPGLNIRVILSLKIAGLLSTNAVTTSLTSADCPFELPLNAS